MSDRTFYNDLARWLLKKYLFASLILNLWPPHQLLACLISYTSTFFFCSAEPIAHDCDEDSKKY